MWHTPHYTWSNRQPSPLAVLIRYPIVTCDSSCQSTFLSEDQGSRKIVPFINGCPSLVLGLYETLAVRESVYPALLFPSLLQERQYSYFTSLPEGPSLIQFLSQSDDPSQASQWSRSIVILVGEKEKGPFLNGPKHSPFWENSPFRLRTILA